MTALAFLVILVLLAFVLTGCGMEARSPDPAQPVGVAATLGQLGSALAWAGGIAAAAGVALSLVSLIYPPLAPFAALFRFAAVGGVGIGGTGAATIWLADNLCTLALAVAACVGGVVWWYWPVLARLWRRRLEGKV